mgnify:CR=1 FL=1
MSLKDFKCGYKSKKRAKKIGTRSIYDIINNVEAPTRWKVDYIRHHYTYYNSFQNMFHNHNGRPNHRKVELNSIIYNIINKEQDPSILKELNRKMIEWNKKRITNNIKNDNINKEVKNEE